MYVVLRCGLNIAVVLIKHGVQVNEQYCWDILLSQQMLDAIIASFITILSLSKTVHWCILHSTQSTAAVQTLNFFSPEPRPNNSPELNATDYKI